MQETVVFLGAGASKAIGLPLTNEILPAVLTRLRNGDLFSGDNNDIVHLRQCLNAVLPGLDEMMKTVSGAELLEKPVPPITDLLSSIDFLLRSANAAMPNFGLEALSRGRTLLERAIFELLVRNDEPANRQMEEIPDAVREEWKGTSEREILSRRPSEFESEVRRTVDWILDLAIHQRVTVISTNYDIEVEQEIYKRLGYLRTFSQVDFGTSVRDPAEGTTYQRPADARIGFYKLHGSLNWLRCDLCDTIYVNPVGPIAYLSFLLGTYMERRRAKGSWISALEESGANQCHCGYRPLRAMIVSPSFVRDVRDPILLEIWRNALGALRRAERWFIVGYSLPPEDVAIRSMLLRAYTGRDDDKKKLEIVVVQKEAKDPEQTRYTLLLPTHVYKAGGLSNYLKSR